MVIGNSDCTVNSQTPRQYRQNSFLRWPWDFRDDDYMKTGLCPNRPEVGRSDYSEQCNDNSGGYYLDTPLLRWSFGNRTRVLSYSRWTIEVVKKICDELFLAQKFQHCTVTRAFCSTHAKNVPNAFVLTLIGTSPTSNLPRCCKTRGWLSWAFIELLNKHSNQLQLSWVVKYDDVLPYLHI